MIATGKPYSNGVNTEVIDTENEEFTCELPNYPLEIRSGGGGILNGNTPIICGGFGGRSRRA